MRLLQRNSRSLSLTDEGRVIYERCQNILSEVEAVQTSADSAQQDVSGTLKVLFPISFDQAMATSLCEGFLRKYPKVDVFFQFYEGDMDLISQNFDIAVMYGPLASSNLVAKPLFNRKMILVASAKYVRSKGAPTSAAELASHQGILLGSSNSMPIWPLGIGTQKSLISFTPRACVNSAAAVKQMVMSNFGVAMLSQSQCQQELDNGDMQQLLPDIELEPMQAYGLYSSRQQLAPRISRFLDHVVQSFDKVEAQQLLQLAPLRAIN